MFRTLKARWHAFLAVPRGQRFQAHHQRAHRGDTPGWVRVAVIVAALVLIVLGLAMIVLPGPGLLVMLAGAVLLAEESVLVARFMDRLDLVAMRVVAGWRARRREKHRD
ncbi:hypothetical protein FHW12_003164 [Dokdonella fugitiva]|uniref:Uncharacterized protein n=1 Tax=Dokdonella fugitiva TaxID=328517 RepID=A0A839F5V7_9GAMM|nr:PGPGW domain-containing protein [Dokdonella fugitiva]MBA8888928.1 hypothetical protein [Dokdonella fugitiva]